jgi:hypothetical protein
MKVWWSLPLYIHLEAKQIKGFILGERNKPFYIKRNAKRIVEIHFSALPFFNSFNAFLFEKKLVKKEGKIVREKN